MSVSDLRGVRGREPLTGIAFFSGFDRVRFLDVFFARTTPSSPTSADTSSVQQTRRPARRAGILMACFDTANVFLVLVEANHMPYYFTGIRRNGDGGMLQNRREIFTFANFLGLSKPDSQAGGGGGSVAF
jgi:hypothetical protein